ncbi:MAG: NAD(P)-binding protein [Candidatus Helarchaeota archaeon]
MNSNKTISNSVCIFGSGIMGINTAIQLADLGFDVYLVDSKENFGGNAAHLYKAFPTDDCFYCVFPTFYKSGIRKCFYRSGIENHPNITLLKNVELIKFSGKLGNFTIKLKQHPIYIDDNCINCGKCIEVCPMISNIDEVYYKSQQVPIISKNYPQCIGTCFTINRALCDPECSKCEEECPTNSIHLNAKSHEIEIKCSYVIIACGFQEFDPELIKNYKYKIIPDVITQDQLALLLDPNGPTHGQLIKPSNKKPVKTIVMLQCVGSRNNEYNKYCSGICCSYAIKQAKYIKENYSDAPTIYIVYIDIRTMGFLEKYYEDARSLDVNFIKGNLTEVEYIHNGNDDFKLNLKVYDAILNKLFIIKSDLLVLTPALISSNECSELCQKIGLKFSNEGFIAVKQDQITTNIDGIFACGSITKPVDLSTSSIISKNITFKIYSDYLKRGGTL